LSATGGEALGKINAPSLRAEPRGMIRRDQPLAVNPRQAVVRSR
jgi:hypothetical protein